jgi:hypothetical protein
MRIRGGGRAIAILLAGVPAFAGAQTLPPANMAGWEIRGALRGTVATYENHLWRFRGAARVEGRFSAQVLYSLGGRRSRFVGGTDVGTWRVADGALCIQWRHWYDRATLCWRIEPINGQWVRFAGQRGAPTFKGTLARFGR